MKRIVLSLLVCLALLCTTSAAAVDISSDHYGRTDVSYSKEELIMTAAEDIAANDDLEPIPGQILVVCTEYPEVKTDELTGKQYVYGYEVDRIQYDIMRDAYKEYSDDTLYVLYLADPSETDDAIEFINSQDEVEIALPNCIVHNPYTGIMTSASANELYDSSSEYYEEIIPHSLLVTSSELPSESDMGFDECGNVISLYGIKITDIQYDWATKLYEESVNSYFYKLTLTDDADDDAAIEILKTVPAVMSVIKNTRIFNPYCGELQTIVDMDDVNIDTAAETTAETPEVIYELTSASVDLPHFSQDDMNAVIEKAGGRVAVISASETDDGLRASVRYFDAAEPTRIVNSAKSGIIDVDRCYFDGFTYAWMFLPDGTLYGLMTGELAASSDYDESWVGGYFGIKGVWSSDGNGFTAESSYAVLPAEVAGIMTLF